MSPRESIRLVQLFIRHHQEHSCLLFQFDVQLGQGQARPPPALYFILPILQRAVKTFKTLPMVVFCDLG
jgi:hypothetical protein